MSGRVYLVCFSRWFIIKILLIICLFVLWCWLFLLLCVFWRYTCVPLMPKICFFDVCICFLCKLSVRAFTYVITSQSAYFWIIYSSIWLWVAFWISLFYFGFIAGMIFPIISSSKITKFMSRNVKGVSFIRGDCRKLPSIMVRHKIVINILLFIVIDR